MIDCFRAFPRRLAVLGAVYFGIGVVLSVVHDQHMDTRTRAGPGRRTGNAISHPVKFFASAYLYILVLLLTNGSKVTSRV